jgi:hypothetical protein
MENTEWVQKYAWHCSKIGTSCIYDDKGELTETGIAYRD